MSSVREWLVLAVKMVVKESKVYIYFPCFWHFPHALLLEALLSVFFVFQYFVFIDFPCSLGLCLAVYRVYIWQSLRSSIILSRWRTWLLMKWFYCEIHAHYTEGSRRQSSAPLKSALLLCCHMAWDCSVWLQPVWQNRPIPVLQCGFTVACMEII